jgi:hypothetical protein
VRDVETGDIVLELRGEVRFLPGARLALDGGRQAEVVEVRLDESTDPPSILLGARVRDTHADGQHGASTLSGVVAVLQRGVAPAGAARVPPQNPTPAPSSSVPGPPGRPVLGVVDAVRRLQLFNERAEQLEQEGFSRVMGGTTTVTTVFGADEGGRPVVEDDGPESEFYRSYCMTLRPFLLDSDGISIGRIDEDVYATQPVSDGLRRRFRAQRDQFNGWYNQPGTISTRAGTPITCREIVETFFYGHMFHVGNRPQSLARKMVYDGWRANPRVFAIIKGEFIDILWSVAGTVRRMREINDEAIVELEGGRGGGPQHLP